MATNTIWAVISALILIILVLLMFLYKLFSSKIKDEKFIKANLSEIESQFQTKNQKISSQKEEIKKLKKQQKFSSRLEKSSKLPENKAESASSEARIRSIEERKETLFYKKLVVVLYDELIRSREQLGLAAPNWQVLFRKALKNADEETNRNFSNIKFEKFFKKDSVQKQNFKDEFAEKFAKRRKEDKK